MPYLDSNDSLLVDFDTWWGGTIFKDTKGNILTRRDLVLSLANKDGGAHVDPSLDEVYAKISRYNALGLLVGHGNIWTSVKHLERPSVRQVAHEVLKTLEPGYTKTHADLGDGYLVGIGFDIQLTPKISPGPAIPHVGRNAPCPCGSGKKYKKCHGKF